MVETKNAPELETVKPALHIHKPKSRFRLFFERLYGKHPSDIIFNFLNYLFFLILFLICLYPFYFVLKTSLTANKLVDGNPTVVFSFEAYGVIFRNEGLVRSFSLSVGVTLVFTVLSTFLTVLSAYPLSRRTLKGKRFFLDFIVCSMLFSGGLIPYYILIKNLGLRENVLVYIIPGLISPFNIIIVRNFIWGIPEDIFDSAHMDGASEMRILFQIVIPLSGPIIATVALWNGVGKWNDWFTGVLYMTKTRDLWMIQQFLRNILISASSAQGVVDPDVMSMSEAVKMATVVVSILPIMIVYPFVQKYFVKGVLLGSIKG
jgi:putative aldouronate transport system permease protein